MRNVTRRTQDGARIDRQPERPTSERSRLVVGTSAGAPIDMVRGTPDLQAFEASKGGDPAAERNSGSGTKCNSTRPPVQDQDLSSTLPASLPPLPSVALWGLCMLQQRRGRIKNEKDRLAEVGRRLKALGCARSQCASTSGSSERRHLKHDASGDDGGSETGGIEALDVEYDEIKAEIRKLQQGYQDGVALQDKLEGGYVKTAQDYLNSRTRRGLQARMKTFAEGFFAEGQRTRSGPAEGRSPSTAHQERPIHNDGVPLSKVQVEPERPGSVAQKPPSDEETILRSVQDLRKLLWQSRAALDRHREEFYEMRTKHFDGIDPGFADDWRPDWTEPEFDLAHLKAGMGWTAHVIQLERDLAKAREVARNRGLIVFDDQVSGFPDDRGGYTSGHEQWLRDHAPVNRIRFWRRAMPPAQDLPSPSEPDTEPSCYINNDDCLESEIHVWDSGSLAAEDDERARIDRVRPEGRLGGTERRQTEDYWKEWNDNSVPPG